jgi:hypothetical protein
MPKVDIDYSNTIFYKIFCKDPAIKEVYVGLTTNFVQRRHAHKQSCKNEKATNYKCKLYNTIRNAGGWDNWQMEIIAFHNCNDSYEARKKEHEYFEKLGATLNSIEPLPKPKIKKSAAKILTEKPKLFCEPCKVYFSHWKARDVHNDTKKHHKMELIHCDNKMEVNNLPQSCFKYYCKNCDYGTSKKSSYDGHNLSTKHKKAMGFNEILPKFCSNFLCKNCDKQYKDNSGLWKHKAKCCYVNNAKLEINHTEPDVKNINSATDKNEMINYLIKENQEFKNMIIKIIKREPL